MNNCHTVVKKYSSHRNFFDLFTSKNIARHNYFICLGKAMTRTKKAVVLILKCMAFVFSTLLIIVFSLYCAMWILVNGPSRTISNLFIETVSETSAAKFLARMYRSQEEIDEIVNRGNSDDDGGYLDNSLIDLPDDTTGVEDDDYKGGSKNGDDEGNDNGQNGSIGDTQNVDTDNTDKVTPDADDGIEIVDVRGETYNGKMMIVHDPKRVFVAVPDSYGENKRGLTLDGYIEKYGAVGGVNGGGFYDPNGTGRGGVPEGIVIYEGKLLWGDYGTEYWIAGLDENGLLYVNKMTPETALSLGIKYAASYGPALVINGVPRTRLYGGLNPRTAIGQRADGAILMLVIDGRSVSSLGATYDDLAEIMVSFGAVNATNLDGGSSSLMSYKGEHLTRSAYIFGYRYMPTAFLVR